MLLNALKKAFYTKKKPKKRKGRDLNTNSQIHKSAIFESTLQEYIVQVVKGFNSRSRAKGF